MKITTNKFVRISYDLNVGENGERELMEQATAQNPCHFIFGAGMMLPAFEQNLEGLGVGDAFHFSLQPDEAYGEFYDENVVEIPREVFEIDGRFDNEFVKIGATVPMMDSSGHQHHGSVLEIKDNVVVMDFNHPLAGETLHFDGQVLDVHEATAEEIAKLASSMECGCGCDCDCGSCESECEQ